VTDAVLPRLPVNVAGIVPVTVNVTDAFGAKDGTFDGVTAIPVNDGFMSVQTTFVAVRVPVFVTTTE
jgi:hypothetical protein